MAQFKFNLHAVLRQRELVEQDRQRDLAQVQRVYQAMEDELRQLDEAVRTTTQDLRDNHLIGPIDVNYLAAHRRFSLSMQRKAIEHAGKMAEVRKQVEVARAALIEAAKQRKAMEKLKERRMEDWSDDQNRRDAAATDEVAQQIGVRLERQALAQAQDKAGTLHKTAEDHSAAGSMSNSLAAGKQTK